MSRTQHQFRIETASDVFEAIRRGMYDARKACNPHYPTLCEVLNPITAELILNERSDLFAQIEKLREELEKARAGIAEAKKP
jgi:hypothetical protein